jgi:hypothetical protein
MIFCSCNNYIIVYYCTQKIEEKTIREKLKWDKAPINNKKLPLVFGERSL